MLKALSKAAAFLALGLCLAIPSAAKAQERYYKIPEAASFRPAAAADEMEAIVNEKSIISVSAEDNRIFVDGEAVAQKSADGALELEGYEQKLNAAGLSLNRTPVNTVTVWAENIDFSDLAEIVIDYESIKKLTDVRELKIVLQNKNEYIALNGESIGAIAAGGKGFRLQIKRLSDVYTVRFFDENGITDKYVTDIKIALPAKNSRQTVYLFAGNRHENWGGQFNPTDGAVEVMTRYSGEYNVASPEIEITDIGELTEYERSAVKFMTVRGYFELDNGKFSPYATLTRYDFAQSLTRIFFALDDDAVCPFTDVDKKHYRYVAAAWQSNIVEGFGDGTFRGSQSVTAEQVLALAARTINRKNGYVYPEQINKYLKFSSDNVISDWAEKEIALAVREGIYSNEMGLRFSDDITRKDAAVILYRLFMIMSNTPEPTELSERNTGGKAYRKTPWNEKNAVIAVCAAAAIDITALILAVLFIRKRRNKNGERRNNTSR